jgi:hypothetical protein
LPGFFLFLSAFNYGKDKARGVAGCPRREGSVN